MMRQQSATEFVSIYSFAIFVISIMLVIAATLSSAVGSSTSPVYSTCTIQPLIPCQQTILTYNGAVPPSGQFTFVLAFRNNLGFLLEFQQTNAINLTASGLTSGHPNTMGTCNPLLAAQGSQVICIVTVNGRSQINQGANTYTQFRLYYGLCTNQSSTSCSFSGAYCANTLTGNFLYYGSSCTYGSGGANTVIIIPYSATGYSFQTLSGPYYDLYSIGITSPNGIVVINGQPYLNNAIVYLTSGSYSLYAQPSAGYRFAGWNEIGPGVSVSSNSLSNTILTLGSGSSIPANPSGNIIESAH
jgi:hypothetical protein